MSEVHCEVCRKPGVRAFMHPAPPDWFFIVTLIEKDEPEIGEMVVFACSETCARNVWKKGPGEKFSLEEMERAVKERFIPIRTVLGTLASIRKDHESGSAEVLRGIDEAIQAVRIAATNYGCHVPADLNSN